MQAVHGKYFSNKGWEKFLRSRLIPGGGVSFGEIEVMLCEIPSKLQVDQELHEAEREEEGEKFEVMFDGFLFSHWKCLLLHYT